MCSISEHFIAFSANVAYFEHLKVFNIIEHFEVFNY